MDEIRMEGVSSPDSGAFYQETSLLCDDDKGAFDSSQIFNPNLMFQPIRSGRDKDRCTNYAFEEIQKVSLLSIHQAARDGRIDVMKQHINAVGKDKKKLNKKDDEQSSALHYAVRYGHFHIVKLLVENGANINIPGDHGATPLHYAARYATKSIKTPAFTPSQSPAPAIRQKYPKTFRRLINFNPKKTNKQVRKKAKSTKSILDYKSKKNSNGQSLRERKNTIHSSLENLSTLFVEEGSSKSSKTLEACGDDGTKDDIGFQYGYEDNKLESECKKPVVIIGHLSKEELTNMKSVDALILPTLKNVRIADVEISTSRSAECFRIKNPDLTSDVADKSVDEQDFLKIFSKDNKQTRLNSAMLPKDSILTYLLNQKAQVNIKDFYGSSPLHYAAMRGNVLATKKLLLQKNVNIELTDRTKMTALHCAASNGSYLVCKLLLERGANFFSQDEEDMTPLHFAAMEGYLDIVQLLFDHAEDQGGLTMLAKMIFCHDRDEQSALHLAVENGHIDVVEYCIMKGSNVNLVKANMISPLHLASTAGLLEVAKLLVENGARIELKNALQETPLHRAALFNRLSIVEYLLDNGACIDCRDKDNETPLLMAVRKNNFETVCLLLKRSASINVKDANDKTCFFVAAEENCEEVFEVLSKHADIEMLLEEFDKHESTPLHVAAMHGHDDIVQQLLKLGACIDAKNDQNLTPLHLAAKFGQSRIVGLLLAKDLSIVNDEDDASNTPLHLAAIEGHVTVVEILLQSGAAVDARNATLWTPLDCAASRGWTQCAKCLLDEDSLINPTDKFKITPLHLASKEGHVEMIKLLLSRNADIARKDHLGSNCLDYAIDNNQREASIAIIASEHWKIALRNSTIEGNKLTTPMRKLIKKLPDVAEKVFNQCITGNGLPKEHPQYALNCTYEFLEDAFTHWGPNIFDCCEFTRQHYKALGVPSKKVPFTTKMATRLKIPGYYKKTSEIKQNHPLKFMVQNERTRLLCHPLVTYLLRRKWSSCGRYVYYSKLLLYIIFLTFITGFALSVKTDLHKITCKNSTFVEACVCQRLNSYVDPVVRFFIDPGKYIVLILAVCSLLIELMKVLSEVHHYLHLHSLIELTAYICAVYYVVESFSWDNKQYLSRCSQWYRGLGAVTVWLSWISLVLFMRKFPKLGIYVVMFTDILKTFAQFSTVFALFIIAFGLGFHLVLYEQKPISFATPARSILKTTMGMLGEFEYDTVFNDLYNPMPVAWMIYVAYLVINCIILMNLLVGLAVDDIKGVQKQAALKRLAMQVDLTLDVEKALPLSIQKKLVKMEELILPNAIKSWSVWSFWTFKSPTTNINVKSDVEIMEEQHSELRETVRGLRTRMKALESQNTRIENMLGLIVKHLNIEQIR